MARFIQVSLTNPIGTWVQKTNALSGFVGDLDDLNPAIRQIVPARDSNVVTVLNYLDSSLSQMQDSVNMEYMKLDSGDFGLIRVDSAIIGYLQVDSGYFGYLQANSADITYLTADSATINGELRVERLVVFGTDSNNSVVLPYGAIDSAEIHDSAVRSRHFQNLVTTLILDSQGQTLKTIFSPGK